MASGIYGILHRGSGKVYIGSACDLTRRWKEHLKVLRGNKHYNRYLQAAWNKYGEAAFTFSVLEEVEDVGTLLKIEQSYLDKIDKEMTYNLLSVAGSSLGFRHSPEVRAKMSVSAKRRGVPVEQRAKITAANTGQKRTGAALANITAFNKSRAGRVVSDATRAKHSAIMKAREPKRGPRSEAGRARISAANKARTGQKATPEVRVKMSASQTARWAARKCL